MQEWFYNAECFFADPSALLPAGSSRAEDAPSAFQTQPLSHSCCLLLPVSQLHPKMLRHCEQGLSPQKIHKVLILQQLAKCSYNENQLCITNLRLLYQ